MLERDPKKRISATDTLKHFFFGGENINEENADNTPEFSETTNHSNNNTDFTVFKE